MSKQIIPGDKMISIRLTADQWRWVHGVLDGQLDAGACEGGNYEVESKALHAATQKIIRAVKTLRPTNRPGPSRAEVHMHELRKAGCTCECPEPETGVAGVSNDCPIHG